MINILKNNKFTLLVIVISIFITKIFESLSIISLAPLVNFYIHDNLSDNNFDIFGYKFSYDQIFKDVTLIKLVLFTAFLFFLKSILAFISRVLSVSFAYNTSRFIMNDLYYKFINTDWLTFNNSNTEKISNTINTESEKFALMLEDLYELFVNLITLLLFLLICFYISWELTLLSLILFITFIYPNYFLEKIIKKHSDKILHSKNYMYSILSETFKLFKNIQILTLHSSFLFNFKNETYKWYNNFKRLVLIKSINTLYIEPGIIIIFGIILFFSKAVFVLEISSLFVFIFFFKRISDSIKNLINIRNNYKSYLPSLKQYEEIQKNLKSFKNGDLKFVKLNQDIKFEKISFKYKQKLIFNELSFKIKKNKINIIVAPSGYGKTTIINLLLGLMKVSKGKILLNDININNYNIFSFRKKISVVTQDLSFSNTSVYSFAKLINPLVKRKDLDHQLKKFKLNYLKQKKLGRHNVKLSGGEQQRLRISIALTLKNEILIFDEPTSSVDQENKDIIIREIIKDSNKSTLIIVTHDNYLKNKLKNYVDSNFIKLK